MTRYIDDPDFVWELDPASEEISRVKSIPEILRELANIIEASPFPSPAHNTPLSDLRLIFEGASRLRDTFGAPAGTNPILDEQCLDTSMIWFYG